jgi:methylated-DNA-[protein]-cysteine S-methyltransferase
MQRRALDTPLGAAVLTASPEGLTSLTFVSGGSLGAASGLAEPATDAVAPDSDEMARARVHLDAGVAWLERYFEGHAAGTLPRLAPVGTPFERSVWQALLNIPRGAVTTYGTIAERLGKPPGTSRAVGQANGRNPLPVFIPCHRVVASGGSLGGYSGGLDRKLWLLAHEGVRALVLRPEARRDAEPTVLPAPEAWAQH